jgi:hypothetical protein
VRGIETPVMWLVSSFSLWCRITKKIRRFGDSGVLVVMERSRSFPHPPSIYTQNLARSEAMAQTLTLTILCPLSSHRPDYIGRSFGLLCSIRREIGKEKIACPARSYGAALGARQRAD